MWSFVNQRKQVWRVAESSSHCRVVTEAYCHESSMTFTRCQALHSLHESSVLAESSPNVAVTSRQPLPSRQASWLFKELRFSALSSFCISVITSSTDVQMQWFKMLWKDTQRTITFMKELSINKVVWMDENAPKFTDSAQGCDLWC